VDRCLRRSGCSGFRFKLVIRFCLSMSASFSNCGWSTSLVFATRTSLCLFTTVSSPFLSALHTTIAFCGAIGTTTTDSTAACSALIAFLLCSRCSSSSRISSRSLCFSSSLSDNTACCFACSSRSSFSASAFSVSLWCACVQRCFFGIAIC